MTRERWRPGPPLLGVMTGWVALFAWTGLVTEPWNYLIAALFGGVLMALAGSLLRTVPLPAYVVPLAQVVVGALALNVVIAHGQSFLRVVPTLDSVKRGRLLDQQRCRQPERLRPLRSRRTSTTPRRC